MNPGDGFDRTVSDWLHADADHRVPDHLDAVLRRTRTERQRPAWSSLERWLPVQTTLRLSPVPRIAWLLVVLALVVAIGLAVLAVGSRPQLPTPFGPARNGQVVTSAVGDIFKLDPATDTKTGLITDPAFDFGVTFSRDGTKFMFLRAPDPTKLDAGLALMVANTDGTGFASSHRSLRASTGRTGPRMGQQIAIPVRRRPSTTAGVINIVNVDGPPGDAGPQCRSTGSRAVVAAADGKRDRLPRGTAADGDPPSGIFAVRPDGTGLRPISNEAGHRRATTPRTSPFRRTARRLTYRSSGQIFRVHILDLGTGDDRTLPAPDRPHCASRRHLLSGRPHASSISAATMPDNTAASWPPADGSGTGHRDRSACDRPPRTGRHQQLRLHARRQAICQLSATR